MTIETRTDAAPTAKALYRALAAGDREAINAIAERGLHRPCRARTSVGHGRGAPRSRGHAAQPVVENRQALQGRSPARRFAGTSRTASFLVTGHYRGVARQSGRRWTRNSPMSSSSTGRAHHLVAPLTDTASLDRGPRSRRTTRGHRLLGNRRRRHDLPQQARPRNAIDLRMGQETLVVSRRIADDPSVRAVLICGNGPTLTVGGDIGYFFESPPEEFGNLFSRMTTPFHEAFRILSRSMRPSSPPPTAPWRAGAGIRLRRRHCAGRGGTKFVTAFAGIGLSGDGGGTWHLPG